MPNNIWADTMMRYGGRMVQPADYSDPRWNEPTLPGYRRMPISAMEAWQFPSQDAIDAAMRASGATYTRGDYLRDLNATAGGTAQNVSRQPGGGNSGSLSLQAAPIPEMDEAVSGRSLLLRELLKRLGLA